MGAPDKLPTPAKFVHPSQGHTWSGRGKKPRWVEIWLEAGNTLEELLARQDAPAAQQAEAELDAQHVSTANLYPSPTNPRKSFPAPAIEEMAESIRRHGILQPILVRPRPAPGLGSSQFEIIAGERRWRAAQVAGLARVPVLVRQLSDQETVEFQVIENLHREDLHALEEAEGYELLLRRHGYSAEELAAKIGKSKAYVYARVKLTALCDAARQAFRDGTLSASTALLVARIPGAELQAKYLDTITTCWNGPLSYREASRVAQQQYMLRLADAPFDTTATDLATIPTAGACTTCPRRSGNQPELFADVASADVCTDPGCFTAKREASAAKQRAEAEAAGREVITGKQAEDIVPPWAITPKARSESGFLALDEPCHQARHLATPIEDAAPIEPEEPDDDADAAAVTAYQSAYDAWEAAMEAFEAREEAAIPTYRQLLAAQGATVSTVLVQHPKTGALVECVAAADAAPMLAARGIEIQRPGSGGDRDKEREKVARQETAFRTHLVDAILLAARDAALDLIELRLVAASAYEQRDFETKRLIVRIWREDDGKVEHEHTNQLGEEIQHMDAPDIYNLLRLITLAGRVRVASYHSDPTTTPAEMVAMAERWGVDLGAVREQAAAKKKGK